MSEDNPSYNRPKDVDFGLPTIHLKPISKKRESIDSASAINKPSATSNPKKGSGSTALVIGLVILLIVIASGGYYAYEQGYLFQPKQELSNANIPPANSKDDVDNGTEMSENEGWDNEGFIKSDSTQDLSQTDSLELEEVIQTPTLETTKVKEALTEIPTSTGKYHIIVASVPSVELAREDGNKLLADDVSIAILYPRAGRNENFRLSVASFATLDEATNQLNFYRQKYGESVWVLRY
jgi:hypothetical protein